MTHKNSLIIPALLLISTTAWPADNQVFEKSAPAPENNLDFPAFGVIDTNHDNLISHEEAFKNESLIKNWDKLDANVDGKIDSTEFLMLKPVTRRVEAQKTDHPQEVEQYEDGKYISPAEQIERNIKEGK
jgi:EF hand